MTPEYEGKAKQILPTTDPQIIIHVFRRDLADLIQTYEIVANRLGVIV